LSTVLPKNRCNGKPPPRVARAVEEAGRSADRHYGNGTNHGLEGCLSKAAFSSLRARFTRVSAGSLLAPEPPRRLAGGREVLAPACGSRCPWRSVPEGDRWM